MKKIVTSLAAASFFTRPRYLRAIPSLVVLTTAMAWGMAPDTPDVDTPQKKARVVLSHNAAVTSLPQRPEDKG
ncbi:MAG: hypothetical protein V4625_04200 [Pseudomonadota bacterium]